MAIRSKKWRVRDKMEGDRVHFVFEENKRKKKRRDFGTKN